MERIARTAGDIPANLSPLAVEWQDDTARRVIASIEALPIKKAYGAEDRKALLDPKPFKDGLLVCRLFLGLSKDQFEAMSRGLLGAGGIGAQRYRKEPEAFIEALVSMGALEMMTAEVNRIPRWSDVLVERLRSGRGSAIAGQRRGRDVENFAEAIVRAVFTEHEKRCSFTGMRKQAAKCDFAIPSKVDPRIVIEAKGYGATGSRMTDVIGDIEKIIAAKRPDTAFLFLTDGMMREQRKSDLNKIIQYQNEGNITRIYTSKMADVFRSGLERLRSEHKL